MKTGSKVYVNFKTVNTVGTITETKVIEEVKHYRLAINNFPEH